MLKSFLNKKKKDQTPEMKEKLISLTCTECGKHFGYLSSYITKSTSDHIDSIKYINPDIKKDVTKCHALNHPIIILSSKSFIVCFRNVS